MPTGQVFASIAQTQADGLTGPKTPFTSLSSDKSIGTVRFLAYGLKLFCLLCEAGAEGACDAVSIDAE